ncbi:MAG: hypothetical protein ACRD40_19715 [Candidatus Acidiferrales bacterium]
MPGRAIVAQPKFAAHRDSHSFVSDWSRVKQLGATVVVVPELIRALLELMTSPGK